MKNGATLVIRCSKTLRRTVDQWAKQNNVKPTEVTRKILEVAFGVEEEQIPVPPGIKKLKPAQEAPRKA
jgi:hypothetical protein